jgi:chemotaxis protein methyltransferase CheR
VSQAYRLQQDQADVILTSTQFELLRDTLASYGGMFLDSGQQRVLEHAIGQRMSALQTDREQYLLLASSPDGRYELQRLIELVLNHETFFFRNRPHLRALQNVLLPELHRKKPAGVPIRIWSAGCASGEEPYSLAITALEALGSPPIRPIEIIATDLSAPAIRRAEQGLYRGRALQNLETPLLERYFEVVGKEYSVTPAIRNLVRFQQVNLLDPFPDELRRIDAIFCQNVTIYFQDAVRRQLIERFYELLPPGGLLFLGFSETLWNVFDHFRSRDVAGAYVYYKESHDIVRRPPKPPERQTPARARAPHRAAPVPRARVTPPIAIVKEVANEEQTLAKIHTLVSAGQSHEALELLTQIAPDSPAAPEAHTLAARIHADRGDLEQASTEAIRALERDPLNDQAYLLVGIVYARQQEWRLAIQQLERARYLKPDSALISFHLASAYAELGQTDHAQREYQSTIWKLREHSPETLIDGVAVEWLRNTCTDQIERLRRRSRG